MLIKSVHNWIMSNFYDALLGTNAFRKFKVDELLFVEYKCLDEGIRTELWNHTNFFSFIVKGKMTWKANGKEYLVKQGEIFFAKKGAIKVETFPNAEFCDVIIFVPDEFVKGVIEKYKISCHSEQKKTGSESIIPVRAEKVLSLYFESLLSYFSQSKPPSEVLLKLKFEELILHILSGDNNPCVTNYFQDLFKYSQISIREIMESNYTSRLTLPEFARLCGRSLSSFKRDFIKIYETPPGSWLTHKRLYYAKSLLETTEKRIHEIVFDAGFTNRSHFVKVFKNEFGMTPLQFRMMVNKV